MINKLISKVIRVCILIKYKSKYNRILSFQEVIIKQREELERVIP